MMTNEMKDLLNEAFYAPEPQNKTAFLKNLRPREISTIEMLWQQATYIRVSVWLFAAAIIAFALGGSYFKVGGTESFIAMLMPFTAAAVVLETKRSQKYNMVELEMATRFSLRSVVLARMTVLGFVSLIILCISSPVIALAFGGKVVMTGINILIPYLVTMIISLRLERSILGRKTEYMSSGVAGIMAIAVYWINNFEPGIAVKYIAAIESWGLIIVAALLALTIYEQWKSINNMEVFSWSYL